MDTAEHPELGLVKFEVTPTSVFPDWQVEDTISLMGRYVREDAGSPEIQEDAQEALALGGGDPLLGVFKKAKQSLTFRNDGQSLFLIRPDVFDDVEMLIRPIDVSLFNRRGVRPFGDCDDFAMYSACLLTALEIDASFRTMAADPDAPSQFSHVYTVASLPDGSEVVMDTSHGPTVGWEAPNEFGRVATWGTNGGLSFERLAVFAAVGYVGWQVFKSMKGRN